MIKIALLHHPYLHVPLVIGDIESYASLNFEHRQTDNGIAPTNRVHVYLLDPVKGNIPFYLMYNSADDYYYVEATDIEIDSLIVYSLNEAIKDHLTRIKLAIPVKGNCNGNF